MKSKWQLKKLDEIAYFNPKETLLKGTIAKKIAMETLIPFCRDVSNYELAPFNGGTKFKNGDTIMARITPCLENGKTSKVSILDDDEIGFGSTEYIVFRAKSETDEDFLYYLITSNKVRDPAIKSMVGSSGRQRVQTDVIANLEIEVPPYNEQKKIGNFLKLIDDKIALNNKINKNLEKQAEALFKKLFIDNHNPQNCKIGKLKELIVTTINGDWGTENETTNNTQKVYCIRGADIPDVSNGNKGKMPIRYILPKNYDKKKLEEGDIVVEISGGSPTQSTGRCAVITKSLLERFDSGMVCTNFCKAIKPKKTFSMFVYFYWNYLYNKKIFFSYENGTTGIKNLDFSNVIEYESVFIPSNEQIALFNKYCQNLYDKIFTNSKQNEVLCLMRDLLLPKLMSGAIDVSTLVI